MPFTQQWRVHCRLRLLFLLALVLGKLFFEPAPTTMLRIELVTQVADRPPGAVDLIVPGVTQVMHDIKFLGERLTDIPVDVVHSGRPRLVQLHLKPFRASAKLTRSVGNEHVFQISGTLVALVLVAQCGEVGHGNEFPCGARFISTK